MSDSEKQPLLLRLVKFGLYALLFVPLVYVRFFYQPFVAPKDFFLLAVVEITLFLFIWLIIFYSKWRPNFTFLGASFFVYIGILFLTSFIGIDPSTSFWGSAERDINGLIWLHLAVVFLITSSVFRTKKDWQTFFIISVCFGLFVAFFQLLSVFGFDIIFHSKNGSTLGNSSFLGTYLLFQILIAIYLAITLEKKRRLFAVVSSIFFLFILLTSTANAAILSFLGGVVLFGLLILIFNSKRIIIKKIGFAIVIILILLFCLVFYLSLLPDSPLHQYILMKTSPARFALWDIAWRAFKERPIFGYGLENFRFVFQKYYNPCFGSNLCGGEIWFDRAHNQILDILVQSGIFGLIAFICLFVSSFITLFKVWKNQLVSGYIIALFIAFFAAYIAQNLSVFDTVTSLLYFTFILAFFHSLKRMKNEEVKKDIDQVQKKETITFILPIILSCILFVSFFFFVIQPVRANLATIAVVRESKMSLRSVLYKQATTLSHFGEDYRRSFLAAQTATVVWDLSSEQRMKGRKFIEKELDIAQEGLLATIQNTPNYIRAYLDLGLIELTRARYYDVSRYKEAEKILQQALEMNHSNPLPYWALAMVYIDQGKVEQALPLAESALALDTHVLDSHLRRIIVYLFSENEALINKKIKETLTDFSSLTTPIESLRSIDKKTNASLLLIRLYYDVDPSGRHR